MRYQGGKAGIAKELAGYIEQVRNGRPYWEPFVGGAWVLAKLNVRDNASFASDYHTFLIALWKEAMAWRRKEIDWPFPQYPSEFQYMQCREQLKGIEDHGIPDHVIGYYGFLCSFLGRFFNSYASIDYIHGLHRSFLNKLYRLPIKTQFFHADFMQAQPPLDGMVIYCDIPYQSTAGYKGIKETFNHEGFWDKVRELSKAGHVVLVSEVHAPDDFSPVLEIRKGESLSVVNDKQDLSNKEYQSRTERLFMYGDVPPMQPALI